MTSRLVEIITSTDDSRRNQPIESVCAEATFAELLAECDALDAFRRECDNLYFRVRALFFLYSIHRFWLPRADGIAAVGHIPFGGYQNLLQRRFEEAIDAFLDVQAARGPSDATCSALAAAYHDLAFQTLADQVRRSVRSQRGNQWMFRITHPADQPLRVRQELLVADGDGLFPILRERTAVRLDLTHSAWSDIFFLGMDYPEAARVLNISVDLGLRGRDPAPRSPIEAFFRVIDEPCLRLTSVDLAAVADVTELAEVFDYARDYLGLLKAGVIASGLVPPGVEGSGESLADLLAQVVGRGRGIEIVSRVRDIPKGSRLAVSTNLLGSLIAVCMRATGQTSALTGGLLERERRVVAARAILGEWLGGSGGGWQDSGGVWPGIKLIAGQPAGVDDPEHGISRGRLLPDHTILDDEHAPPAVRDALCASLVLVHGGMAQNVGPVLEMVTEKYLLRSAAEWHARAEALGVLDDVRVGLRTGDVRAIAAATMRNFEGPIQSIIPWASNRFTEAVIESVRAQFGDQFWGFLMLGGMSGGGMGFFFDPDVRERAQAAMQEILDAHKADFESGLPFAMKPVVYDFAINESGSTAELLAGGDALLPAVYYAMMAPRLLRRDPNGLTSAQRAELDRFGVACRVDPDRQWVVPKLFDSMLQRGARTGADGVSLADELVGGGFDPELHEQIRKNLREGRLGLAQNRLPASSRIEDVGEDDVVDALGGLADEMRQFGEVLIAAGAVGVVTLAGGAASRWTQGAGVVKALHPFAAMAGGDASRWRRFLDVHIAKTRKTARGGETIPHVFTTSRFTHDAIARYADGLAVDGVDIRLSPGRAVGLRLVPMARDLRFLWEEMPQQILDEQQQKVRESLNAALMGWAQRTGEGSDYTDNVPSQCLHPVGHWFEVPNLLRNGTLAALLDDHPALQFLLLHNIDTLGANIDPALLGSHAQRGACLTFEVIPRRLDDLGGGLARVDGRVRLVEGLAMPREEDEFALSYYNTLTTWIDIDQLLEAFGLDRASLGDAGRVARAVRELGARMPTYVTLKEVKKRWGHGQEDVFPVAQFEKLWGDMSVLSEVHSDFAVVPRMRGQQLKDPAQLDGWLRDGSADYVAALGEWDWMAALT